MSRPIIATIGSIPASMYIASMFVDGSNLSGTYGGLQQLDGITGTETTIGTSAQTMALLRVPIAQLSSKAVTPVACAIAAPRFAGGAPPGSAEALLGASGKSMTFLSSEEDASNTTSVGALVADFGSMALWQNVRLGDWTWIAGGVPMIYDGLALTEVGFIGQPLTPTVGISPATSAAVVPAITTLTYQTVFVQQDLNGNIHRSPPSSQTIVSTFSGGAAGCILALATQNVTFRQAQSFGAGVIGPTPIQIEIYRNNSGAGLTVMQRIATVPNDTSQPIITYTDTVPDAGGIMPNAPILYTTGGIVPSDGPPNLTALAVHAGRVIGISEDGQSAYFSTTLTKSEAPWFTDAFTVGWPEGPVTAQWSLEQRLHAATTEDIYYVFGDGPNNAGAGSDLQLPSLWQAHIGVKDQRGIALFQGGAILNTPKGPYLEDRAGQFTWLSQFRRTLQTYPIMTAIVPMDSDGAVRFCLQSAEGDSQTGVVVHFDYRHSRWATHVLGGGSVGSGYVDACLIGGKFHSAVAAVVFNTPFSALEQENSASNLDSSGGQSVWVPMSVTMGWMHPAGMLGYGRMDLAQFVGVSTTPHGITLQMARDFSQSFDAQVATWTDADLASVATAPLYFLQMDGQNARGGAFSFCISDAPPTSAAIGTGAGPVLKQLAARFTAKAGENRQLSKVEKR